MLCLSSRRKGEAHNVGAHLNRRSHPMFCQRLVPSRTSEPLNVLPEATAGPTRPLTNTTSAVSVVVSPRRGSHLDRRSHPMYCQRPAQDTQDFNLSNNAPQREPQPQPRFLHANDDLTSEMRYTARGRFMSCLPCTFPPQQRCQSTKQPRPSSSKPLHPCLLPQHHRCQWPAQTYA